MPPASIQRLLSRPSRRFALLVVLGAAVVAAPLAEIWRRQGLELKVAFDARRALEAVALAAHAQRALAAHRPYAGAVLAGRSEQEPERLRRQQAVDGEVAALVAALEAQRLHRALDEADQLRAEWAGLLEGIGRRQMPAAASDAAHELLHEQAFVIMDLAAAAGGLQGQTGRALGHDQWTLALRTLPQYAGALAALVAPPAPTTMTVADPVTAPVADFRPVGPGRKAVRAALRVANEAGHALAALDATGADEPAPSPALVRALVALRQSATALVESAGASATGAPAEGVARRAQVLGLEAHATLVNSLDSQLAESITVLQRERLLVVIAGLLAACVGAVGALRVLPRRDGFAPADATDGFGRDASRATGPDALAGPGAESQGPASDLIERLRRRAAEAGAEADGAIAPKLPKPR